jgi:hypothetical protein
MAGLIPELANKYMVAEAEANDTGTKTISALHPSQTPVHYFHNNQAG